MTHRLKTWAQYFDAVWEGEKTFEVRKDDRGFSVGDTIFLDETDNTGSVLTGRSLAALIIYKLDGGSFGIEAGYCVLGIMVGFRRSLISNNE